LTNNDNKGAITLIPYKSKTNHILDTLIIFPNLKTIGFDTLFVHFEQFIGMLEAEIGSVLSVVTN